MVSFSQSPLLHDGAALLAPLHALAGRRRELEAGLAGRFVHGATDYEITRFRFIGPNAGHEPIRLGLFAGVHGDEPAGCAALVEFAAALALAQDAAQRGARAVAGRPVPQAQRQPRRLPWRRPKRSSSRRSARRLPPW